MSHVPTTAADWQPSQHISTLTLDEPANIRRARHIEHERNVAISDLLAANRFKLVATPEDGPYTLHLAIPESPRLNFHVTGQAQETSVIPLPLRPYKPLIKDYFIICESYFNAIRELSPSQIETIDMARRGLHDEGSVQLRDALSAQIDLDKATARRLFTLICILHLRA